MTRRDFFKAAIGPLVVGLCAASPPGKPRGPVYACSDRFPGATPGPGRGTRCFDAETEDEVFGVFFYDTNTFRLGRYRMDENGIGYMYTAAGRALEHLDEIWEYRPLRFTFRP